YENERLKEALINEKKRRQRGKPLLLEASQQYDGGAVFWSPTKVQEARERQGQKEAEQERLQLQKSEHALLQEQQKKEKVRLLEEKRRMRAIAKEARQQEQQQKVAKREEEKVARAAQKQLQAETKLAKNGIRKSSKRVAQVSKPIDVDAASVDDVGPVTTQSSRGRKINLPERYK
ncbi:hypothetical protein EJ04DRAFT_521620, partial [Polyplosphaeria fusca]